MRHVTDGELHAFLDGALDLLPDRRGEEVRIHVSECPACRERLQDEESLRSRAAEILGDPDLGSLALPTFEELRERGEAVARPRRDGEEIHYRGPLRGVPLAWAATVVLAVGVGWMGGEVWRRRPYGVEERAIRVVNPDSVAPETGLAGYRAESPPETASAPAPDVQGGTFSPARSVTPVAVSREDAGKALSLDERVVTKSAPGQGSGLGAVMGDEVTRDDAALPPTSTVRARPDSGLQAAREPARAPAFGLGEGGRTSRLEEELAALPVPDEKSFAVPGLRVLSVEWEEWVPGERALRIRQLLSMGDTLELRYLGLLMGAEPVGDSGPPIPAVEEDMTKEIPLSPAVLEASLPPGWNQVEMRWGRGWLVARAPLPEESIKALLRSLR